MDIVGGMSELVGVPAPPPGPGVAPPFAVPPRDRDNKRLWIGLGIGGLVLVLCCVGGIAGIGVLAAGGDSIAKSQASSVVRTFLEAIGNEDYPEAYGQICDEITEKVSLDDFERAYRGDRLDSFTVGAVNATSTITVDATLDWQDRGTVEARYTLVPATPVLKICGGL
jgi:hypothetical protein